MGEGKNKSSTCFLILPVKQVEGVLSTTSITYYQLTNSKFTYLPASR
jgi:hypothetical protein